MSNVNSVKYAMAAVAGFSLGSVISAQPGFTLSLESPSSALPVGWFGLPGTLDFNNDGCDDLPQISRFGEVSRDGGLWMDVDGDPELEYLHMGILQSADNPNCTDSRPVPTPDTFFSGENGIPYLLFYPYLSLGLFAFNPDGTPVPGQWPVLIGPSTAFATLSAGDIDGNGDDEIVVHTRQFFGDNFLVVLNSDGTQNQSFNGGVGFQIGEVFKAPALANLDQDPGLEIVIAEQFQGGLDLTVIDNDGSFFPGFPLVLDTFRDADPVYSGDPFNFPAGAGGSGANPAIGDVDNDGVNEIVIPSWTDLHIVEPDGTISLEWEPPAFAGLPASQQAEGDAPTFAAYSTPSLVDLDNNGDLEIVFPVTITNQITANIFPIPKPQMYVLNHDGTVFPGWPQTYPSRPSGSGATNMNTPVSVADIDADGVYDILYSDNCFGDDNISVPGLQDCSTMMAWSADGTAKPGFPVASEPDEQNRVFGIVGNQRMLTIADVDNDGKMEIWRDNNRAARPNQVYNHDGTLAEGWDLVANFPTIDGTGFPNFGDPNNDGFMDIALAISNISQVTTFNENPPAEDNPNGDRGSYYFFSSDTIPYSPERAPVSTYGYNNQRTFVVPALPSPPACIADWNSDGFVNSEDIEDFLDDLAVNGGFTDLTNDGSRDSFDFFFFLEFVNAGCS